MNKINYETPSVDIILFKNEDIIVTSGMGGNIGGEDDDFGGEFGR